MSSSTRFAATVEDLDVDDMDFPLPEAPTPYPAILAHPPQLPTPPPRALPPNAVRIGQTTADGARIVEDASQFKKWICLYPLYFDKSRSIPKGRRVPLSQAIFAPHGRQLSVAVKQAGFNVCYEPGKTHPRDFFNPGRARVQLFDDQGRLARPDVASRKRLMEVVAEKMKLVVVPRDREPSLQELIDSGAMPMLPGMGPGGEEPEEEELPLVVKPPAQKVSKKPAKNKKKGKGNVNLV
ncbi:signal recognition particle subunit [Kickxella alabastrina]|uniref:Signal recognition particle subunit n=1 Tax=Kickxella alabastrina TaxID=61397 RepID=A0ACC1IAD6_9FUNG|nr:signal recognition particle subunit [Kickxella alabastrina]